MAVMKIEDLKLSPEVLSTYQKKVEKESHTIANSLPWMDVYQTIQLIWSILTRGFDKENPIQKIKGKIIDGRNREVAVRVINDIVTSEALAEGKEPRLIEAAYVEIDPKTSKDDLVTAVFKGNIARRNMSVAQVAAWLVKNSESKGIEELQSALSPNQTYINQCKALVKGNRPDLLDRILHEGLAILDAKKIMAAESIVNLKAEVKKDQEQPKAKEKSEDSGFPVAVAPLTEEQKSVTSPVAEVVVPDEDEVPKFFDEEGNEIPENLLRVFAAKKEFKAIIASITGIKKEVEVLLATEAGEYLLEFKQGIADAFKYINSKLKECTPYAVCQHCSSTGIEPGKKKPCTQCNGARWLSVKRFQDHVPKVAKIVTDNPLEPIVIPESANPFEVESQSFDVDAVFGDSV